MMERKMTKSLLSAPTVISSILQVCRAWRKVTASKNEKHSNTRYHRRLFRPCLRSTSSAIHCGHSFTGMLSFTTVSYILWTEKLQGASFAARESLMARVLEKNRLQIQLRYKDLKIGSARQYTKNLLLFQPFQFLFKALLVHFSLAF